MCWFPPYSPSTGQASVLSLIEAGDLLWCVSEPILAEYREAISRPKFSAIRAERLQGVLSTLSQAAVFIPLATVAESADEPDNRFLECAEAAGADYLVTGNKRDFPARWKKTKIVNARELFAALKK